MRTIVAAYGYIRPGENVRAWGADCVLDRPGDLPLALTALGR